VIDDGYDDLDYEEPKNRFWLAIAYKWLVGIGAIAAVVFGGMYLLNSGDSRETQTAQKTSVPIIQAAKGPVKVRPVKPGGRVVPHQDREVYREYESARRQDGRKTVVEDFLAPRKRRTAARSVVARGPTCRKKPNLIAEVEWLRTASWRLAARQLDRVAPGAGDAKRGARDKVGGPQRGSMAGAFRIQLGAFRSLTTAQRRWRGLKRKHASLLGRLNMVIERVDLGPRGIFYRLQAGPIRAERTARGLCRSLVRRRVNCILVSG